MKYLKLTHGALVFEIDNDEKKLFRVSQGYGKHKKFIWTSYKTDRTNENLVDIFARTDPRFLATLNNLIK